MDTASPVTASAVVVCYREHAKRVPPPLRPPLRYLDLTILLGAWREVARRVEASGAELVVAHPCQFLQAPPCIRYTPVPSVYFCHETRRADYDVAAASARNPKTALAYAPLYRWQRCTDRDGVRASAAVLTNSAFSARQIAAIYGRHAEVISLGVPEHLSPADGTVTPRHVLSVGNLVKNKGHELVIHAASASRRRWPVVIVTPRPAQSEEHRLLTVAAQLGVSLSVRTGISDLELRDLYRHAVATLYLATMESFGLASLEAQACGCPVIVADEGGLPETVIAGETGWTVPRDARVAAQYLDQLENAGLRAVLSRNAAAHAARFSWERSTQEFERVALATADGPRSS